jgi:hypothetical protein
MNQSLAAHLRANTSNVGLIFHQHFVKQMEDINELIGCAEISKKSLETRSEMRSETEYE